MGRLIDFLVSIWNAIVGGGGSPTAINVNGKKLCAPLFYQDSGGIIHATWNYLSKSTEAQEWCRKKIKEAAVSGEVPAIAFLLTPNAEGGNLFNQTNPGSVNAANLDAAAARMKELCEAGIAVFVTLYTDDQAPRWWEISAHLPGWQAVWAKISPYVSGCLLSIESTEGGNYLKVQDGIAKMRIAMPGAQLYGTHQQWHQNWNSASNTPASAQVIFCETTNHPSINPGMNLLKSDVENMIASAGAARLVIHEYYFYPTAEMRTWLRSKNLKGVG